MTEVRMILDAVLQCGIIGSQSVELFHAAQIELIRKQRADRAHERLMLVLKDPKKFARSALARGLHA